MPHLEVIEVDLILEQRFRGAPGKVILLTEDRDVAHVLRIGVQPAHPPAVVRETLVGRPPFAVRADVRRTLAPRERCSRTRAGRAGCIREQTANPRATSFPRTSARDRTRRSTRSHCA